MNIVQISIIWLNRIINLMKYPIAILLFIATPFLLLKLFDILEIMFKYREQYYPLLWGFGIYIVVWQILFRNIANGWLYPLEHELTHTLFAIATFHKISDIRVFRGGGYVRYYTMDNSNWLITISPYFFPTFSALVLSLFYLSKEQFSNFFLGLLGFSIAYHIHSTYIETHYGQRDLKEVGILYSWIFLPSANLLSMIVILALIPNDRIYLEVVMDKFYDYYLKNIAILDKLLLGYLE